MKGKHGAWRESREGALMIEVRPPKLLPAPDGTAGLSAGGRQQPRHTCPRRKGLARGVNVTEESNMGIACDAWHTFWQIVWLRRQNLLAKVISTLACWTDYHGTQELIIVKSPVGWRYLRYRTTRSLERHKENHTCPKTVWNGDTASVRKPCEMRQNFQNSSSIWFLSVKGGNITFSLSLMQTLKVMTNFETFKYVSKFVMIFQSLRGMFQSLSFQSLHLRPYILPTSNLLSVVVRISSYKT